MPSLSSDFPLEETLRRLSSILQQKEMWRSKALEIQNTLSKNHFTSDKEEKDAMSQGDFQMGQVLVAFLRNTFPKDGILCEDLEEIQSQNSFRWVIDPIDGSMNFVRGNPLFAVSIGLEHRETAILGMILLPGLSSCYHAIMGEGAFKDGKKIQVSQTPSLSLGMFTPHLPSVRHNIVKEVVSDLTAFLAYARSFRRSGSFILDLCWLSEGLLDGIWENRLQLWDVVAGTVILREAGGSITDLEGARYLTGNKEAIASNGILHAEILKLINSSRSNFGRN